jgi:DNA-directed RNA polymerase subunit RPC12/RpoP
MSVEMEINSKKNDEIIKIIIDHRKNNNDKECLMDEIDSCFNTCPICLDYVEESNIVSLPCKHKFHFACYNEYFFKNLLDKKDNMQCPYCKDKIFEVNSGEGSSNSRPQYMVVGSFVSSISENDNDEIERSQTNCCIDMSTCNKIVQLATHSGLFFLLIFGFMKLTAISISNGP